MAHVIPAKAVLSNLRPGEKSLWRLIPTGSTTIAQPEFVQAYAKNLRDTRANAQYALDQFWDTLMKFALQNKAVELEFLGAHLSIEGSVSSMNEQPTREKNPVRLKIQIKGQAAEAIAALTVKNATEMVEAYLHEIMQNGASGVNRIENDEPITINCKGGKINAAAEDEGVWLEKDGLIVAKAELTFSSENKVVVSFGSLALENGVYDLAMATRNGASAESVSPRKLMRKITLAR